MSQFRRRIAAVALLLGIAAPAEAGYYELSANGWYTKYVTGETLGELSTETKQNLGGGLAYNFFGDMLLEFKYADQKTTDRYTQVSLADGKIYRINRTSEFKNYSLNLVLEFAPRKASFRPYISGGVGYMQRKDATAGTYEDSVLRNGQTPLQFQDTPESSSLSAEGGVGFKLFVADRLAFDATFNVIATDLDKAQVYMNYSGSAGLRFFF